MLASCSCYASLAVSITDVCASLLFAIVIAIVMIAISALGIVTAFAPVLLLLCIAA